MTAADQAALAARMRSAAVVLADLKIAYGYENNIPLALDTTIAWLTGEADYLDRHPPRDDTKEDI